MKTFLITLAVLTAVAIPAFAQSFCTCDGTGNVLTFTHNPITLPTQNIATGQRGLDSFAMVPSTRLASSPNGPAATGGGSLGYNEMLRNF
ncbi:MAG: hypothetical protein WBR32_08420 [Pseudolabrys sp.]